jgi:hypothetical protein
MVEPMIASRPVARTGTRRYYDVSLTKFILLWLGTLGLFHFYWFYKQWDYERENGADVVPLLRALFAPFFVYGLFRGIHRECDDHDATNNWNPAMLALIYIAGILSFKFAGRTFWSVGYLTFLPILPVQASINELNRRLAPDLPANTGYSWWQVLLLLVGLSLFALGVLSRLWYWMR